MIEFSIPIFYIFLHNRSFQDMLPQISLWRTLEVAGHGPLFLRINGRHYFLENWPKDVIFLKTTSRVEIIIIISTAIRIKNNKNFGFYIRAIFYIKYYYNQDLQLVKLMGTVNSQK